MDDTSFRFCLQVDSLTFVGEEYEDLVSYTVSLSVFQMGLCIGATSSITPKGLFAVFLRFNAYLRGALECGSEHSRW